MRDVYLKMKLQKISNELEELNNTIDELNDVIIENISFDKKNPLEKSFKTIQNSIININNNLKKDVISKINV